ncbi:MAG: hypothetical protein ACR2O8_03990, partial [Rhizobiaceae bacterium]
MPATPVPVTPVPVTPVDENNLATYLQTAKLAWAQYGSGGLNAVIAALEDENNAQRYDYQQVAGLVLDHVEYAN